MKEQTGHFKGTKGLQLYWQAWLPDGPPKALVVVIHGVGEHIGRYGNLVNALVPASYLVAGYDQRGHGRSEGQRGHINSWEEFRSDIRIFLDMAKKLAPGLPVFLYGHSQGSLEVLDYVLHDPSGLTGVIVSGTATEPTDAAPPVLVLVAKVMSRIIPTFKLKVSLPGTSVSRDPQVAQAYMDDPLVHWERSARWATEGLRTIDFIKSHVAEIKLPILFLHGEKDALVSVAGAQQCFEQVSCTDKKICVYVDGAHEPHNDLQCAQVLSDVLGWLDQHLQ